MIRRAVAGVALGVAPCTASAYGPDGHRIAGLLAEPLLCDRAWAEVTALIDRRPFEDLGLWADRIRDDPAWTHTAPWHYMNIDDGEPLAGYEHRPEGDVLWAIERFSRVLADRSEPDEARAEALGFLVHFVVDVHQPLHVGRAADRGGNTIDVRWDGGSTNLHRFWDTNAIRMRGLPPARYAQRLAPVLERLERAGDETLPVAWAEESLSLRARVYGFDPRTGALDADYLAFAAETTETRLAQSALRLGRTLNGLLCPAEPD